MEDFEASCRIQAGREKGGPQLWLFQTARAFGEFEKELGEFVPRRRRSLIGAGINFPKPRMEDQQLPEQISGDSRRMDGKNRTHKDARPLTGKHVDTHAPLRRVSGRTHFCQIAERGHKDTGTRFDRFPLQNFQKNIGEFDKRGVFDPNNLEAIFALRTR